MASSGVSEGPFESSREKAKNTVVVPTHSGSGELLISVLSAALKSSFLVVQIPFWVVHSLGVYSGYSSLPSPVLDIVSTIFGGLALRYHSVDRPDQHHLFPRIV